MITTRWIQAAQHFGDPLSPDHALAEELYAQVMNDTEEDFVACATALAVEDSNEPVKQQEHKVIVCEPLFETDFKGECPICLQDMTMIDFCITRCGHTFHTSCVIESLVNIDSCPICRRIIWPQESDDEESVDEEGEEGEGEEGEGSVYEEESVEDEGNMVEEGNTAEDTVVEGSVDQGQDIHSLIFTIHNDLCPCAAMDECKDVRDEGDEEEGEIRE
jgi:hypothetical protein